MSNNEIDPRILAARQRLERANSYTSYGNLPYEIDFNELIGADAERLLELPEKWEHNASNSNDRDYLTPAMNMWQHSSLFLDEQHWKDEAEMREPPLEDFYLGGAQRLLGPLASRKALELRNPLKDAVGELREPLRAIVVNHFYIDFSHTEIAQAFSTSVETVEFLTQIALDQIRTRFDI